MNKRLHRKRNTRFDGRGWMPPHVVLHEDKQVLFLIESGMAYLAMGNFMKNFAKVGFRTRFGGAQ